MIKITKRLSKKAGLPAGTLMFIGEKKVEAVKVVWMEYDEKTVKEEVVTDLSTLPSCKEKGKVNWIAVNGIHQVDIIENIGKQYNIHYLTLEDIVDTLNRPKLDEFSTYFFIEVNTFELDEECDDLKTEQISLIMTGNTVLTFQEGKEGLFNILKERINDKKAAIRKFSADFLTYSILDTIVDSYFSIMETLTDQIEIVENRLIKNPTEGTIEQVHKLKRNVLLLRKFIGPLDNIMRYIVEERISAIKKDTIPYFRDIFDHVSQVIDSIRTLNEMLSGMFNTYLSSMNNKMSIGIRFLSIIATTFMPLSFIAGVYGMNFKYMPELQWKGGYYLVLGIMASVVISMLIFFKRKKIL